MAVVKRTNRLMKLSWIVLKFCKYTANAWHLLTTICSNVKFVSSCLLKVVCNKIGGINENKPHHVEFLEKERNLANIIQNVISYLDILKNSDTNVYNFCDCNFYDWCNINDTRHARFRSYQAWQTTAWKSITRRAYLLLLAKTGWLGE